MKKMRSISLVAVLLAGFIGSVPAQAGKKAATKKTAANKLAADPSLEELLKGQDDMTRGQSSKGQMSMHIKTARWERSLTIKMWSQGKDKTLMRIVKPAKEKGTSTLKVDKNIWNYLPKIDRTIKVPASMMSGSWMGSHLSNDDLVQESRFSEDYDCKITQKPKAAQATEHWQISCTPHANAPVVWGRVDLSLRGDNRLADSVKYFDEKGKLVRSLIFSDFKQIGDHQMAMHMSVKPADKPDEFTEINYDDIAFNVKLPASTFSRQALKR